MSQETALKSVYFEGCIHDYILEFIKGEKNNLNNLITEIKDEENKSSKIIHWFQDCQANAHLLDKRLTVLVKALLEVRWIERENEVITNYYNFVSTLITVNPVHLRLVLSSLTRLFQDVKLDSEGDGVGHNVRVFQTIHKLLSTTFTLIPQSSVIAQSVFESLFPFMKKPLKVLIKGRCSPGIINQIVCYKKAKENYMKHLLFVTSYRPSLRPFIIEVILKNLVQLDAHSPKHEIEEAEAVDEDDEIFQMDEDMEDDDDDESVNNSNIEVKDLTMKHTLANNLDVLLRFFYQYLHEICYKKGELQLEESRKLFRELVFAFERVVLPVHQLSHVQFCTFYVCSFKQSFYDSFVDFCWKKVTDVNVSTIIRKASVCYIASFLARAKFIPLSTAKASLEAMSDWCHRYLKQLIDTNSTSYTGDALRHGPFYSVCQAIFYVIIFRHQQILDSNKGHNYIQSLNLQHLIASPLNPLKFCLSTVVGLFASTMRAHQLLYCDSIIKKNNRQVLPVVGSTANSQDNLLESFFPFDPYILKRSLPFIEPLYTEWTGEVPTSNEDEDMQDSHDEEFLNAVEEGTQALSFKDNSLVCSPSPGFGFVITPTF